MSWLFASGGQSTGASALASVLLMNIHDLFPLGLTGLISLQSKDSQESSPNHKTWSAGEGNGKTLQHSCLENPMNSLKREPRTLWIKHML